MMWISELENPDAIQSIFDEEPSLASVRLMKVELLEEGPTVNVSLALRDYPCRPPLRWSRIKANAARLDLQLPGVSQVTINGWSTDNVVDCTIERSAANEIAVSLRNSKMAFQAICVGIRVSQIKGYQRR
ncbi:MAG TPA: Imm50 family immunity protein [Acidobacteriaceae bacterium]|nr:Imm50 family immunity protein [Acidobacteriaceae bacterium]